jgi:N-acetylglutamate synthase-like GNAT family acetyltransferase
LESPTWKKARGYSTFQFSRSYCGRMDVLIREAERKDLQAVLELYKQLHPRDIPPPPASELARIWSQIRSGPVVHCYIAEQEGRVAATGTLAVLPNLTRGGRPYGLIENVVTDKALRRRGIGKELLRHMLQEAERKDCYKVMVLTDVHREGTIEFYKAAGFKAGLKHGLVALAPFEK